MKNIIEIWQPRYHDNKVLLATYRVSPNKNYIVFTKDKRLAGNMYSCDAEVIRKCPVESNGKISCFAVPMEELKLEGKV